MLDTAPENRAITQFTTGSAVRFDRTTTKNDKEATTRTSNIAILEADLKIAFIVVAC